MNDLTTNLENIDSRISSACLKAGRNSDEVSILAVSKRHSAAKIRHLHTAGQVAFGENYVQEALQKQKELQDLEIEWHFIGPVQSNKTREIASQFSWIQSVDRAKILNRLARQRPGGLPPLNVCLQVNIDEEEQKSGASVEDIPYLAKLTSSLSGLRFRGLMAIPRSPQAGGDSMDSFHRLRILFGTLQEEGLSPDTLSMGMSSDFELAIQAGSTMIRVGTDLFGARE
jgi:pyridoxal phosphate enzyme (YggS family)